MKLQHKETVPNCGVIIKKAILRLVMHLKPWSRQLNAADSEGKMRANGSWSKNLDQYIL